MKLILLLFAVFIAKANSLFQLPSCDPVVDDDCNDNEDDARKYVGSLNDIFVEQRNKIVVAYWNFYTNINDENKQAYNKQWTTRNNVHKNAAIKLKKFSWNKFNDTGLVRLATAYYVNGDDISDDIFQRQTNLSTKLQVTYSTAKVCIFEESCEEDCKKVVELEPNITNAMQTSQNYEELFYFWTEWRNVLGNELRDDYIEFVNISNSAAKSKGFRDLKERWLQQYETDGLPAILQHVYAKPHEYQGESVSLADIYQELHTFVKGKLIKKYNEQRANIKKDGLIPDHLLGDIQAQTWDNLFRIVKPFPEVHAINLTKALIDKKYSVRDMAKTANDFFVRLGFEPMTQKFWDYSMFEKPDDGRNVSCHGQSLDFYDKDDYRIKICAEVKQDDFFNLYTLVGHIAYNMQYRKNPFPYRAGANVGIFQAIGDLASLAASTSSNLRKLGLVEPEDNLSNVTVEDNSSNNTVNIGNVTKYQKNEINDLMSLALNRIAFLPYALSLELWRWNFFSGKINETNLNKEFWKLKNKFQGVEAADLRSEKNLDPLALFHVPHHHTYVEYFISHITQFQFYEALCKKSGEYNPGSADGKLLHQCDYSVGGVKTGELLRNMMKKGASVHWKKALEEVTGLHCLSGKSMVKYFLPLYRYLKQENAKSDIKPWK